MKHLYLSILLLFSSNLFAQDDLLGQWYLHYIEVDGVEQYSTIPNSYNDIFFEDNIDDDLNFYGAVCDNGYGGIYSVIDESSIEISDFAALTGFCNYGAESSLFLYPYFEVLTENSIINTLSYSITGSGSDEVLTLTNSENNKAIYGRSPLPENSLPGIWYLHKIVKNGIEEINVFNPNFSLNLGSGAGVFGGINFNGNAICNDYFGEYYLNTLTSIRVGYFGITLVICDSIEAENYESVYYSFFNNYPDSNFSILDYEVSGTGDDQTLTLTDENGDYLLYGRQTLSVSENEINNLSIRLNENPVRSELKLSIEGHYDADLNAQVYSIDGKRILEQKIYSERSINVVQLNSGLYFLVVSSDGNFKQTLKFIKH